MWLVRLRASVRRRAGGEPDIWGDEQGDAAEAREAYRVLTRQLRYGLPSPGKLLTPREVTMGLEGAWGGAKGSCPTEVFNPEVVRGPYPTEVVR